MSNLAVVFLLLGRPNLEDILAILLGHPARKFVFPGLQPAALGALWKKPRPMRAMRGNALEAYHFNSTLSAREASSKYCQTSTSKQRELREQNRLLPYPCKRTLVSLGFREIPNFLNPTSSRGRTPPKQTEGAQTPKAYLCPPSLLPDMWSATCSWPCHLTEQVSLSLASRNIAAILSCS